MKKNNYKLINFYLKQSLDKAFNSDKLSIRLQRKVKKIKEELSLGRMRDIRIN
jgi:hypothetical protein